MSTQFFYSSESTRSKSELTRYKTELTCYKSEITRYKTELTRYKSEITPRSKTTIRNQCGFNFPPRGVLRHFLHDAHLGRTRQVSSHDDVKIL